ncbi:hypothetical protein E2C01_022466 [Portunus trituberculatus]|uniref:Uncharacterized protein n=1 Tax=Portunus trituberculatus TaxID=210409 RepID=A0A5B7E900_PORTR|nr:hypothetical protein [Portunus trituberculatus]
MLVLLPLLLHFSDVEGRRRVEYCRWKAPQSAWRGQPGLIAGKDTIIGHIGGVIGVVSHLTRRCHPDMK